MPVPSARRDLFRRAPRRPLPTSGGRRASWRSGRERPASHLPRKCAAPRTFPPGRRPLDGVLVEPGDERRSDEQGVRVEPVGDEPDE